VEGSTLVHTTGADDKARLPLTTVGAAAAAIGIAPGAPDLFVPTTPLEPDRAVSFDAAAVAVFSWWYGFAAAVLAQLRADPASQPDGAPPPSLVQLWPEHFDIATDLGATDAGARANFGASPGDAAHPEPYLYVGPWDFERVGASDPFWNEPFGASLPYAALGSAADARAAAVTFFRAGRDHLSA
jgi:hypothetical protein